MAVHFIIMGCGRVGAAAAKRLEARGHSVAVIDQNPDAFRKLGSDFEGQKLTGIGFDRQVLKQAGTAEAYGFAAVSSGDNSNILAARVVRETFGVSNVVARIYDPDRAEVFERLGISTLATVPWAADQILQSLLPQSGGREFRDPSGLIDMAQMDNHPGWIGVDLRSIENSIEARIAFVTRLGKAELPSRDMVLQEGDQLHVLAPSRKVESVQRILARQPELED